MNKKFIFIVIFTIAIVLWIAQTPQVSFRIAHYYSQHGKHEQAIKVYKRAFQSGSTRDSKEAITNLVQDYIQWVKPMLQEGNNAFRQGEFEKEKSIYAQIINIYEDYQQTFGRYQFDETLTKDWRQVAKEAYVRLADIHHQKGEWEEAFKDYREALLIFPSSPEIIKVLIEFHYTDRLLELGDLSGAQFVHEKALEFHLSPNP